MRILGIDPGTRIAGYGVVDLVQDFKLKAVAAGAWKLNNENDLPSRLATLAIEFRRVVAAYAPTHMCMELSFLADNPRTALFLGHARGVVLSEAHQLGLVISEISATSAKKIISGNGRADKVLIANMMSQLLQFPLDNLPLDATDALAIACADGMRMRMGIQNIADKNFLQMSMQNKIVLQEWQKKAKRKKSQRIGNFASLLKVK